MSQRDKLAGEIEDPMVTGALENFKASVDAWSDAAYRRPRAVAKATQHSWRLAASWVLGCTLAAGSLAGGSYERHHRQELARIEATKAAVRAAEQKAELERKAAEQSVKATVVTERQPTKVKRVANENEDLLASVDSDVSRQVPAAMEPLAQMMVDNGTN
jgi:hypothetical protein